MYKFSAIIKASVLLILIGVTVGSLEAEEYSSASFILRDPIISIEGGRSTSPSFEYFSSTGQTVLGENTSSSFVSRAGFLYFSTGVIPPTPTPPPPTVSPSSGGGGAYIFPTATGVIISGKAYPLSKVTLLKDGQIVASTIAGPDAKFQISLVTLATGNYTFSVFGEDHQGHRSALFTFLVFVTQGATTAISGIFVTPTIGVDKQEVKQGENIVIFGKSSPQSEVTIMVNSLKEIFVKTITDENGAYLYNFDTSLLEIGLHYTKSKAASGGAISNFGKIITFRVSDQTVFSKLTHSCPEKGDFNADCKVNIVDFSIAAYWHKRLNPPARIDLNSDGKIDLIDFSILAFYWTG